MTTYHDGYWLPKNIRAKLIGPDTPFDDFVPAWDQHRRGRSSGEVGARWPRLEAEQWRELLSRLEMNRARMPRGGAYWTRLQNALSAVGQRLKDPADPLHRQAMATLPTYTGYSEAMIGFALGSLDLFDLGQLSAALAQKLTWRAGKDWQALDGLGGRVRFYPHRSWQTLRGRLGPSARPIFGPAAAPNLVVGYGAGNVPGTALLIALLGLATTLGGEAPPTLVIRNSRHEPLFTPLVLDALEAADPDLLGSLATLVWDYDEAAVAKRLLPKADLIIAAAGDDAIQQIAATAERVSRKPAMRFHAHGHKVSFSAIGREVLRRGLCASPDDDPLIDTVTMLAALDSAFWDQHGCLSARIHFVETGDDGHYSPLDYARRLVQQLRILETALPRGAWPRQHLHSRFDQYKLLESSGQVQVLSTYDDKFVVAVDRRTFQRDAQSARIFAATVNDCQGRVIIVRPVDDLMEVPYRYLQFIPPGNLQSLSVAVGQPGEGLTPQFLRFAEACGARGVTAIRVVGRGAFPQLAYSWDGLLPLDLVRQRPAGHFTTIEFERPYEAILETFGQLQ